MMTSDAMGCGSALAGQSFWLVGLLLLIGLSLLLGWWYLRRVTPTHPQVQVHPTDRPNRRDDDLKF